MKKIYIVDDDRNIVESLSIVLKRGGYEVQAQCDEIAVVDNAAAFGSDLIILDVMFPEDSGLGFELARRLRGDGRTKDIPILMLSAVNEKHIYPGKFSNKDRDESWVPVNEFVEKPVDPGELLKKVESLLGAKGQNRSK